jgi:Tol biopolymer transport system component
LLLGFAHLRPKEVIVAEPMRLQITPPATLAPEGSFALSPDGRHLAFAALGSDGIARLWVRALNAFEARSLVGTESSYVRPFFWSPDSRFIAFESGGKLRKTDVSGGPPQTICDLSGILVGGSWNSDGVITPGNSSGGLQRVSAAGGAKSPLTEPNRSRQETNHTYPTYLPDGRHFLYLCTSGKPEDSG